MYRQDIKNYNRRTYRITPTGDGRLDLGSAFTYNRLNSLMTE